MTTWTERMHRRAATIGTVVTSCAHQSSSPYPRRIEKVKFGLPLEQVCRKDIPGPLLVMVLRLNKEGPFKRDVFRAPGHQANMKKLVHILQHGRLVNMENFSVHTIASVLKKFLRKIPGGIFGPEREKRLFELIEWENLEEKREEAQKLIRGLDLNAQRLLTLLIGTFRMISSRFDAVACPTRMSSEALGVSVAPSFFHSCVSEGKNACLEDVTRFKSATRIITFLIDNFGVSNLFGRDNYEYYAKITGRILRVENDWIFCVRYPVETAICSSEESQSTPVLVDSEVSNDGVESLDAAIIEREPSLSQTASGRLSVSLGGNGIFQKTCRIVDSPGADKLPKGSQVASSCQVLSSRVMSPCEERAVMSEEATAAEDLRARNKYAESTRSLSYLPMVHERQTARMRTRSEWFLSPNIATDCATSSVHMAAGIGDSIAEEDSCYYSLTILPSAAGLCDTNSSSSTDGGAVAKGPQARPLASVENRRPRSGVCVGAVAVKGDWSCWGPGVNSKVKCVRRDQSVNNVLQGEACSGKTEATNAGSGLKREDEEGMLTSGSEEESKIVRRTSSRKEKRGPKESAADSSAASVASPKKKQRESGDLEQENSVVGIN
ncbi:unnamed protein product [Notodromas monacha]|uniref:Rho-GAP domain-containing protein n=1 Tax=Notodromas monacha TaxID=399045 RepID=A0A7R9BDT9_9CRUS|nr:unnamed protein product [Notodromas monacha]CAG0913484.1 unnamed protein product [Notodromas monacha]